MIFRIPTELSEKGIEDFQKIYKETFNEEISRTEAKEKGLRLIWFISYVLNEDD